ncbi:Hypothetical_protein [Hexamita inflata]|uniref:Hypothetical_protein n=1 Tax=Hexamita inflata TaxID=28002 RepID=A0AA86PZF9_9EUKA|nr:Hypothetical protein HINF_LOCUS34388 [Hexamita inflata]CAI9976023.1 Hypothetical protein HINF_LOCUS63668 [Hexamita inflata]
MDQFLEVHNDIIQKVDDINLFIGEMMKYDQLHDKTYQQLLQQIEQVQQTLYSLSGSSTACLEQLTQISKILNATRYSCRFLVFQDSSEQLEADYNDLLTLIDDLRQVIDTIIKQFGSQPSQPQPKRAISQTQRQNPLEAFAEEEPVKQNNQDKFQKLQQMVNKKKEKEAIQQVTTQVKTRQSEEKSPKPVMKSLIPQDFKYTQKPDPKRSPVVEKPQKKPEPVKSPPNFTPEYDYQENIESPINNNKIQFDAESPQNVQNSQLGFSQMPDQEVLKQLHHLLIRIDMLEERERGSKSQNQQLINDVSNIKKENDTLKKQVLALNSVVNSFKTEIISLKTELESVQNTLQDQNKPIEKEIELVQPFTFENKKMKQVLQAAEEPKRIEEPKRNEELKRGKGNLDEEYANFLKFLKSKK